jgi:hypothetical protein
LRRGKDNLSKLVQSVTIAGEENRPPRKFGTLTGQIEFAPQAFDPMTDEEVHGPASEIKTP